MSSLEKTKLPEAEKGAWNQALRHYHIFLSNRRERRWSLRKISQTGKRGGKKKTRDNSRTEVKRRKCFKICQLCWMPLKDKLRQVMIKSGKATVIIAASVRHGTWSLFGVIVREKWKMKRKWRGDWRQLFQVVLLWRGERNVAVGRKSETKGEI